MGELTRAKKPAAHRHNQERAPLLFLLRSFLITLRLSPHVYNVRYTTRPQAPVRRKAAGPYTLINLYKQEI